MHRPTSGRRRSASTTPSWATSSGTLTSPGGTTATLFERDGSGGNNLCQVVFDDAAARAVHVGGGGGRPVHRQLAPGGRRSTDLLTAPVDGDWTFKVVDGAARDTGSIRAVSLHVTGFAAD